MPDKKQEMELVELPERDQLLVQKTFEQIKPLLDELTAAAAPSEEMLYGIVRRAMMATPSDEEMESLINIQLRAQELAVSKMATPDIPQSIQDELTMLREKVKDLEETNDSLLRFCDALRGERDEAKKASPFNPEKFDLYWVTPEWDTLVIKSKDDNDNPIVIHWTIKNNQQHDTLFYRDFWPNKEKGTKKGTWLRFNGDMPQTVSEVLHVLSSKEWVPNKDYTEELRKATRDGVKWLNENAKRPAEPKTS